jgi:hypothetical protein
MLLALLAVAVSEELAVFALLLAVLAVFAVLAIFAVLVGEQAAVILLLVLFALLAVAVGKELTVFVLFLAVLAVLAVLISLGSRLAGVNAGCKRRAKDQAGGQGETDPQWTLHALLLLSKTRFLETTPPG